MLRRSGALGALGALGASRVSALSVVLRSRSGHAPVVFGPCFRARA
ncbi:hypothetical protein DP49_5032 [Burkholderia pseudomallei]|nr:hypothetical protein DP49_5032 [Burkholderia pseudomallei]